jgi:putative ABC transport system permease protein
MVTRTINDLYFVLSVREMVITPLSLCKWIALGLGATVLAVLVPALEATTAPPRAVFSRSMVETKLRRMIPFASLAGAAVILVGICALLFPSKNIPLSFGALFAIIAGFALLTPALVVVLIRLLQPVMGFFFGILGKMAARGVVASLSRTGIALAALIIAVSATVGVGIMIDSFRLTVVQWLENILRADIYVTSVGLSTGRDKAPLDPTLVERLSATSGVAMTTLARNVFLESAEGVTEMFVVEIPRDSFEGYQFKEGNTEAAWKAFQKGAVIVSEPYAYHHDLHKDDALRLRTALGEREFPIAGVYYDYRSDRGKVTISRGTYQKFWKDRTVDSLGIYLESGRDLEIVMEQLRKQVDGDQRVIVYSNRSLREASITTFDRTFAVTGVLRLLAILVAFVGILNALMAMQVERSRELAILRANGMTPRQVWGLVSAETGVIGFIAGLLAIPLGIVQALALIHVINLRSFGWTMQTCISPDILIQAGALAMLAAIVAGIYPALRMARTSPALALREE